MPVPDLGVLDTVISVVVVILLLSMVVQSIQTTIKKLLKFKSRQIRSSIDKLLAHVEASAPGDPQHAATADKVMAHFEKLGRTTALGRHAIESISKVDLSKVVTTIEGSAFLPQPAREAVTSFFRAVREAQTAVNALSAVQLPPASMATLNQVRMQIETFVAHVAALFEGGDETKMNAQLLVRDVLSLRELDVTGALAAVTALQTEVDRAAAADPANAPLRDAAAADPANAPLRDAAAAVRALTTALGNANARMTQLVGRLRERVEAIETWYDTVMLGFQERYARHMRTWSFAISLVLVIIVNADIFQVYKRLATNQLAQARVFEQYRILTAQDPANPEKAFDQAIALYPAMGMELYDWTLPSAGQLIGWLIMAALLSLGAPFWHDTLESLFGLKNFLRDRTETRKVEQQSGAGLTRS